MNKKPAIKETNYEVIIQQAVKAGIEAGRAQIDSRSKEAYRATERRLYALTTLIGKVENAKERLRDLETHGPQARSKDIARFSRSGMRIDAEDIWDAMITDEQAKIASDEYEIATMKEALGNIEDDRYYPAIEGRYFSKLSDEEIAAQIPCDTTTVWRQRVRLVQIVAVWLYGAQAV
jgi:hypothetical protein